MSNDALIDGLEDTIERLKTDNANLERRLEEAALAIAELTSKNEEMAEELEEIGWDDAHEEPPEVELPICRVCLHTIRHEPICNDCARKMCRQCGGTDHLACISAMPSATLILEPMKCAKCGATTSFLERRDGEFFCETC